MKIRLSYPASVENAGDHAATTWHDSQVVDVVRCVAFFPLERVPSWQDTQLTAMPVWSNLAGVHALVVLQLSHWAVGGM